MKWCPGLAVVLVLATSAAVHAQGYGSGYRMVYSGYRLQEGEAIPPAVGTPAPETRIRKAVPDESAYAHAPAMVHDSEIYGSMGCCDPCYQRGLFWRRPLWSCGSSCCPPVASCGCAPLADCCDSCCRPSLLQRLHCQCQARWSAVTCRVRGWSGSMWGGCDSCGQSNLWGGCGCRSGEVWQDQAHDPLMPRTSPPMPEPHDAPGPAAEPEPVPKATRRYVPSTVVPSSAWKWTPIRTSF
ncbi:MAG: hypothetical protein U0935_23025 [Pirellulales bacterium]